MMMDNVKSSRQCYVLALEEKKKTNIDDLRNRKRKLILDQMDDITKKMKATMSSIEKDIKQSDKLAIQAEAEKDFSVLDMANSLKQLVKEKCEELTVLSKEEKYLKETSLSSILTSIHL